MLFPSGWPEKSKEEGAGGKGEALTEAEIEGMGHSSEIGMEWIGEVRTCTRRSAPCRAALI